MMIHTRVIGIGQPLAGDDGVGRAVLEQLRRRDLPPGVALVDCADPVELVPLLRTPGRVVIIDATAGTRAGAVVALTPEDVGRGAAPLSSHALGVGDAISLARSLNGGRDVSRVDIIAVGIDRAMCDRVGLSPAVAAAVPAAAHRVLALLHHERGGTSFGGL